MKTISERVDTLREEVRAAAHAIHEDPELGMQEFHAVATLTGLLEKHGFAIERGVCGLETAFIASYKGEKEGPVIGFLAEYDALNGLGHACGHNLIGALACCNAIALKDAIDEYGGEVQVIGAPAEETNGGKVPLAANGYYDDLAVAMMAHPFGRHAASGSMNAIDSQRFEFFGKSAHAAGAPHEGINALNGVLKTFDLIDALRQHITPDARVSGVIKDGGKAANIVPDYAMAEFYIRANTSAYLIGFSEKVKNCARAAALATGPPGDHELRGLVRRPAHERDAVRPHRAAHEGIRRHAGHGALRQHGFFRHRQRQLPLPDRPSVVRRHG